MHNTVVLVYSLWDWLAIGFKFINANFQCSIKTDDFKCNTSKYILHMSTLVQNTCCKLPLHPSNRFTFTQADCSAFVRIWRKLTMCITVKNEAAKSCILIKNFIKTTMWTSFHCNLNKKKLLYLFVDDILMHTDMNTHLPAYCLLLVEFWQLKLFDNSCKITLPPPPPKKKWKFTGMLRLFCWQLHGWSYFTTHSTRLKMCTHKLDNKL
jgi:hypothetical protein